MGRRWSGGVAARMGTDEGLAKDTGGGIGGRVDTLTPGGHHRTSGRAIAIMYYLTTLEL